MESRSPRPTRPATAPARSRSAAAGADRRGVGPLRADLGHHDRRRPARRKPIPARPCDPTPIALPAGPQELLISPGPAFVVDGAELDGPLAAEIRTAPTTSAEVTSWGPDRRQIDVARAATARVLVIPESVNPGWVAHTADGVTLTPVLVNGWQQGWVVPAGQQGTITLSFPSNTSYRTGLAAGLALLPLLLLMALVPGPPARTGPPRRGPGRRACSVPSACCRRRGDRRSDRGRRVSPPRSPSGTWWTNGGTTG